MTSGHKSNWTGSPTSDTLQTKIDSRLQNFVDEALRLCLDKEIPRKEAEKMILDNLNEGIKYVKNYYLNKKMTDYPVFLDDPRFEGEDGNLVIQTNTLSEERLPSCYPPEDDCVPEKAFSL